MRISIITIISLILLALQGCASPIYQPLVIAPDISKIKSSNTTKKENIAVKYSGISPIYNTFPLGFDNIVHSKGEKELYEGTVGMTSSNMPISSTYALLISLDKFFNKVIWIEPEEPKKYKNIYVLNYEINEVDFTVNLHKKDSYLTFPAQTDADTIVSIKYNLIYNNNLVSQGNITGNANSKNSEKEHNMLFKKTITEAATTISALASIYSQMGASYADLNNIDDDYEKRDLKRRLDQRQETLAMIQNQISESISDVNKPSKNINLNDKQDYNKVIIALGGSLKYPPDGLDDYAIGEFWLGPKNHAMKRSLMKATEIALEKLIIEIIKEISSHKRIAHET